MARTAYITHPECRLHEMGEVHPECPQRLVAIDAALEAEGVKTVLQCHEAPMASIEALCRVHGRAYVENLHRQAPLAGLVQLDADTAMNPHSWKAALRAAGAGILGVDLVMRGDADHAFCAIRPPGHHALREEAMGFCFFNNIAIAAEHAIEQYNRERVAIVDFDVHHGNGTEEFFSGDPRVLMCGIFQHPFFPYCGVESPAGNMLNFPLPQGAGSAAFREVVQRHWLPRLEEFRPQMIMISAGFDAHRDDTIGGLGLVEEDFSWCTEVLGGVASRHAGGRIVSMLEGGYNLSALARSVVAHVRALLDLA